jgi:hypothetical protein
METLPFRVQAYFLLSSSLESYGPEDDPPDPPPDETVPAL